MHARLPSALCFASSSWLASGLSLIVLLTTSPPLVGQGIVELPPAQLKLVAGTVDTLMKQADEFIEDGQAEEAIAIIRRIQARYSQQLIVDPLAARSGFSRYQTVGRRCQLWIAGLSHRLPVALDIYRSQVDPLAQLWFNKAQASRDKLLLERIVQTLPNSGIGDKAMLLLGDMRLEEGNSAGARAAWQQIHAFLRSPSGPLATGPSGVSLWHALGRVDPQSDQISLALLAPGEAETTAYSYPDSDIPLAEVLSRLVLASLLDGDFVRGRWELQLLHQLFPQAEGTIAGESGLLVDLLAGFLASSRQWQSDADSSWTTYAGTPIRQSRCSSPLDLRSEPAWTRSLSPQSAQGDLLARGRYRIAESVDGLLSSHPVAWGGQLFLHDGKQLMAYNVEDGQPAWGTPDGVIYTVPGTGLDSRPKAAEVVGVARSTITIVNDRLFARMGSGVTGLARGEDLLTVAPSLVVGLDLGSEGKLLDGFPLRPADSRWAFEGTPVSDGESLYLLLRYSDQVRSQFHVACYSIESGRQLWQRQVCAADMPARGRWPEQSHHLLTLHRGTLFCSPGAGLVAALSSQNGQLAWITTYPRTPLEIGNPRNTGRHVFRDLAPCCVDGSTLLCAPPDCAHLFALDLTSGRLIWQSAGGIAEDAKYLLGVVDGQLVASGDRLYWLDVYNGELREQFPRLGSQGVDQPRPDPAGWGRGLIAAGRIYWPLPDTIMVFENGPDNAGWQRKQVIDLAARSASGGNLVLSGNRLFIVTADRVHAFHNDR
jgi:outer membrane protein assembly factor BamB